MSYDTMENKIVIALTPLGLIIGRMVEGVLTSPRTLMANKSKESKEAINVGFQELIGSPELFFLGAVPHYISENVSLNELYIQVVSGIKIIHP